MSNNCVRCVKNPRDGARITSMLCKECEAKEWDDQVRKALLQYPALRDFVDTWGSHCGASKEVFAGHAMRLLLAVITQAGGGDDPKQGKTVSDLMHALVDNVEQDLLLALRFAYYVKADPLVPDKMYDEAEREYINRPEVEDTPLMQPGSDKEDDYPARVRALCLYLNLSRMDQSTGRAPSAAISAKPSPVKRPAKAKGAKAAPEVATGLLF